MPSDVFFADLRATPRRNLIDKVQALLENAGLDGRVKKGDLVAIKIHFGEAGNTSFIRPVFVRRVVDSIKELGARPFLTDANTLYSGSRGDAVRHLETAIRNGFDYAVVGAPLVIADGLRGKTAVRVPIEGGRSKEVVVGAEVIEADALVGLAHFKGHELSGFGGALKNIGMGCAAREGKLAQHSGVAPYVQQNDCVACGDCAASCASTAITMGDKAEIDPKRCVGCAECIVVCPEGAIQIQWDQGPRAVQEKMVEHAFGALKGKREKSLFLNFVTQVSPACDCYGYSDAPIVHDVGILSSSDPVAIDQASVDLVNAQPGIPGTALASGLEPGGDKFRGVYPKIDWSIQLVHAQKLGLGAPEYRRVDV